MQGKVGFAALIDNNQPFYTFTKHRINQSKSGKKKKLPGIAKNQTSWEVTIIRLHSIGSLHTKDKDKNNLNSGEWKKK